MRFFKVFIFSLVTVISSVAFGESSDGDLQCFAVGAEEDHEMGEWLRKGNIPEFGPGSSAYFYREPIMNGDERVAEKLYIVQNVYEDRHGYMLIISVFSIDGSELEKEPMDRELQKHLSVETFLSKDESAIRHLSAEHYGSKKIRCFYQ